MKLSLAPLSSEDLSKVAHVSVAPEQEKFSGTVAEAFEAAEPGIDFHAIFDGDIAVGFFKIDTGYGQNYPFAGEHGLGLRAFMIDKAQQGRGIAKTSVGLLPGYLRELYPAADALFLTVNLANPAAISAYLKGGFIDTGEIWPHGSAGPQHIMRLFLVTSA